MEDALELEWLRLVYFRSPAGSASKAAAFRAVIVHVEARVNRARREGDSRGGDLW